MHATPWTDQSKRWTLEEVHALPEDGNKYELVYGALWVTPTPTDRHETILVRLTRILDPYVEAHGLGYVYHPKAVVRIGRDVEVEPDLMVRQPNPDPDGAWERAPLPVLVVEVLSPSTRRRDLVEKRELYLSLGILEYWIVAGEARTVTVCAAGREARVVDGRLAWTPVDVTEPLVVELRRGCSGRRTPRRPSLEDASVPRPLRCAQGPRDDAPSRPRRVLRYAQDDRAARSRGCRERSAHPPHPPRLPA